MLQELISKGMEQKMSEQALNSISSAKSSQNLTEIINAAISSGVPKEDILFTSNLARGLDYYTGMIFEVSLPGYDGGSCGGGGRYDKLIEHLGGQSVPAVGIAFGFDRMVEAADFFKLISPLLNGTEVLLTVFDKKTINFSLQSASILRKNKIKTEIYPALDKLDKQLKYADKKGIPYVVIIGPDEAKKNIVKLKNMKTGEQTELNIDELVIKLKSS